MNIKEKWNRLKHWQKGALLGFSILTIIVMLFSLWVDFVSSKSPDPHIPFYLGFIIMFIVYVIPGTIIGGVIGYFINRKKR